MADCTASDFPCNDVKAQGLCRQVGGSCWYMATMNFVHLAEPKLRCHGFTDDNWETVYDFATEVTKCSLEERQLLCAELPAHMRALHDKYNEHHPSPTSYNIQNGGSVESLMCAMFNITNDDVYLACSKPGGILVGDEKLKAAIAENTERNAVLINVILSKLTLTNSQDAATELEGIVLSLQDVAEDAGRELIGGAILLGFPPFFPQKKELTTHALSWNFCKSPQTPTEQEITLCDSNLDAAAHRAPDEMFRLVSETYWPGIVSNFVDLASKPIYFEMHCPYFFGVYAICV